MFHRHKWQKYDVEYNEPVSGEYTGLTMTAYERTIFGFTNITWRCAKCPEVRIERHTGKVSL